MRWKPVTTQRFHRAVYHLTITKFQIWINWSSVRNVRAVEVAFYKVPHNFGLFSIWTSSSIFEFFGQKCWTALDWTLDLCFWIMMPFWTDNYYLIINSYISVKQLMTKFFQQYRMYASVKIYFLHRMLLVHATIILGVYRRRIWKDMIENRNWSVQ